jgi:hypothetical protein
MKFLGLLSLFAVVVVWQLVSDRAGMRTLGVTIIGGAVLSQLSGKGVPYGWEGREPSGYITGWGAVAFNCAMGGLGLSAVVWPDAALGILGWGQ